MKRKWLVIIVLTALVLIILISERDISESMLKVALLEVMSLEEEMNEDIEYISVFGDAIDDVSDMSVEEIENFVEKEFGVKAYNYDLDELVKEGIEDSRLEYLNGLTIYFENAFLTKDSYILVVHKYRGNLAYRGYEITLYEKDGKWYIKNSRSSGTD